MNKSIDAFTLFKNSLKSPKEFKNGNQGFKAKVVYKEGGHERVEELNVILICEGYESCNIRIDEGKILRAGEVFLSFNPEYQDYNFITDGCLIITGESKKVAYEVKITEV